MKKRVLAGLLTTMILLMPAGVQAEETLLDAGEVRVEEATSGISEGNEDVTAWEYQLGTGAEETYVSGIDFLDSGTEKSDSSKEIFPAGNSSLQEAVFPEVELDADEKELQKEELLSAGLPGQEELVQAGAQPPMPTAGTDLLSIKSIQSGQAILNWKAIEDADGYHFNYGLIGDLSDGKTFSVAGGESDHCIRKNLEGGKTYYFRIRTYVIWNGTKIFSEWSAIKSVFIPMPIAAPVPTEMSSSNDTTFRFRWNPVSGADGYQVAYSKVSSMAGKKTMSITKKGSDGVVTHGVTIKKLQSLTDYYARVRAFRIYGGERFYSDWSEIRNVKTRISPTVITRLSCPRIGQVTISWRTIAAAEGYQIQYSTNSDLSGARYASVKSGKNRYTRKDLTPGKTWYFRVRTYVMEGGERVCSAWCGIKSIFALSTPVPTTVEYLRTTGSSSFSVRLQNIPGIDGYEVQYGTDSAAGNGAITVFAPVSANKAAEKNITGLKAETTYYVKARTFWNYSGDRYYSAWSAIKSVRTAANEISGYWSGNSFVRSDGTRLSGGAFRIAGRNYFFNADGINITTPNSMQIVTVSRTPKVNNAYYIKSNGQAAIDEWCDVSTCKGQDGYWEGYFRSLKKAYFNSEGKLDLSIVPADTYQWAMAEVTNKSERSDGVNVVREGFWTLTPQNGKTAYYQWICKNATTNLEECRGVVSATGTIKNLKFGMGEESNPWCLRYMNCTIIRQNGYLP